MASRSRPCAGGGASSVTRPAVDEERGRDWDWEVLGLRKGVEERLGGRLGDPLMGANASNLDL